MWKKFIAMTLAALTIVGCLTACGGAENQPQETETTAQTEPAEEAKVLKVLTLGHSLAVDSGHMLALIANAEGYQEMKVGTLYYSGCPLSRHVKYLTENSPEYDLYISETTNAQQIPAIMEKVTMQDALRLDYWDIIVMQDVPFGSAKSETFTNGDIQTIQAYVNANKLNPNAVFAWHNPWATPVDNDLRSSYPGESNPYFTRYAEYNDDRDALVNAINKCVGEHIMTDETFAFLIPSGAAMDNALSSYLTEKDLFRDYAHATDLGRVIASYTWFCALTGVEKLEEIKLDVIPKNFFRSTMGFEDRVLTDAEKQLILESVNNALANPLQVTQSQYTQAPA